MTLKHLSTLSFAILSAISPLLALETQTTPILSSKERLADTQLANPKSPKKAWKTPHTKPIEVPPEEWSEMTGTWGGARTTLRNAGVDITATYGNDLLGNPVGGMHGGFAYADSYGLNLRLDFEKLAHITGLEFFASSVFRSGTNLSQKSIGNQFPVAQLFGGETYRLNELHLKETLCDGNLVLKAGRLDGGNDFLASPFYCQFVNNAFCGNPISIFFNVPFTAYPNSTWGAYLDFRPHNSLLFKFAVYNTNANISANRYHGVNFTFHNTQGMLLISEWVYGNNQRPHTRGYRGNYKIGYYYVTGQAPKFEGGTQKGNYGYYVLLDQIVYRRNLGKTVQFYTPFLTFLFAPPDRNEFPFFMSGGLIINGPTASRRDDSISFGVAYGHYSPVLRKVQRLAKNRGITGGYGDKPENFETILEANYWVQVTKWLAITPDVQYVINPRGYGTIQNALVIGIELSANL